MSVESTMEYVVLTEEQAAAAKPMSEYGVLWERNPLWRALRVGKPVFVPYMTPHSLSQYYPQAKARHCTITMKQVVVDGTPGTLVMLDRELRHSAFTDKREERLRRRKDRPRALEEAARRTP